MGLIGIAISLLVDLPQGLDEGRVGISYLGTEPHLIEGFWAQVASSGVLVLCGLLLGLYAKQAARAGGEPAKRRRLRGRRMSSPASGQTASAGLGAGT
jgi:hypothetical protein